MIKMNKRVSHYIILNLILIFLYFQAVEPFLNRNLLLIAADQTCSDQLDLAEENYYEGKLDETIELIIQCLENKSLDNPSKVRAFTILLRTYLAKDKEESAKEIVFKILNIDKNFQPSLEQERPRLVNFVAEVKKEYKQTKEKEEIQIADSTKTEKNTWLWIGAGGAVVIGAVAILVSGGSEDSNDEKKRDLPAPPQFP